MHKGCQNGAPCLPSPPAPPYPSSSCVHRGVWKAANESEVQVLRLLRQDLPNGLILDHAFLLFQILRALLLKLRVGVLI